MWNVLRLRRPIGRAYSLLSSAFKGVLPLSTPGSVSIFSSAPLASISKLLNINSVPQQPPNSNINFTTDLLKAYTNFHTPQRTWRRWSEDVQLQVIHNAKPKIRTKRRHPLDSRPQMKGVVLRTIIKKPKKPNSANRKCVVVRLSNGKEKIAYVPGEGHNLQEHNIVLVRFGKTKDVPGLRLKVIRGKYDCAHVVKKTATPK